MIQIDQEKCTGCGLCVQICHERCIELIEDKLVINRMYCSRCSQCAAICPSQALTWNGVPSDRFDENRLPSAAQLDELFKQRRSIRRFKKENIDQTLLTEIVDYGIYAPTHNYSLRVIIVDDFVIIKSLDDILVRLVSLVYNLAYKPKAVAWLARKVGMEEEFLLNKPKVVRVINDGKAFNYPAAIVFIVGDKKIPLSVDSAQYALANMTYYAHVKGIASCLWGNGPIFMDRSPKARKLLGLNRQDKIFGALFLGYPEVVFRNKVEGRKMPVQWMSAFQDEVMNLNTIRQIREPG